MTTSNHTAPYTSGPPENSTTTGDANAWDGLGGTKVSTGQIGRRDYYLTPTGIFLHTDLILDWRAEGTFNSQHIRGLGVKAMRVWDFGWQHAAKGWGTGEEGDI